MHWFRIKGTCGIKETDALVPQANGCGAQSVAPRSTARSQAFNTQAFDTQAFDKTIVSTHQARHHSQTETEMSALPFALAGTLPQPSVSCRAFA